MGYMARKLVEQKFCLKLAGPFAYRTDIPHLSKPLFVASRMVALLEAAGYSHSKMYKLVMLSPKPKLNFIKPDLVALVEDGELHPDIKGSQLTDMCVRCVLLYFSYYTGDTDYIATMDSARERRMLRLSLMPTLQRVRECEGLAGA